MYLQQDMPTFISYLTTIIPGVFVFLWTLIFIDFKNFRTSKDGYTKFTADDPINCYAKYVPNKTVSD